MEIVTLSSKGQLVIPSHVRATAHLHAGDTLEVRYLDGEIRLKPVAPTRSTTLDEVAGCLSVQSNSPLKRLSDNQAHAAIMERLKAEDVATLSRAPKTKKSTA